MNIWYHKAAKEFKVIKSCFFEVIGFSALFSMWFCLVNDGSAHRKSKFPLVCAKQFTTRFILFVLSLSVEQTRMRSTDQKFVMEMNCLATVSSVTNVNES